MQKQYDTSEINLSPAAKRLAVIYFGRLAAQDSGEDLSSAQVWYAAASAAECLQQAHEDATELRSRGVAGREIMCVRQMGESDSQFYLDLVPQWVQATRQTA